jgi:ABC-type branched-subunit amino acid transport system permease subunit
MHGGPWDRIAAYTPGAMLDMFQHGLLQLNAMLVALIFIATGLGVAAIWVRLGVAVERRALMSAAVATAAAGVVVACAFVHPSWDVSENQRHSFSEVDEAALAHITAPLSIEAHLAPEDPRRSDLEHQALSKLRRVLPSVKVRYVSATSIGLLEQANTGYGEIW